MSPADRIARLEADNASLEAAAEEAASVAEAFGADAAKARAQLAELRDVTRRKDRRIARLEAALSRSRTQHLSSLESDSTSADPDAAAADASSSSSSVSRQPSDAAMSHPAAAVTTQPADETVVAAAVAALRAFPDHVLAAAGATVDARRRLAPLFVAAQSALVATVLAHSAPAVAPLRPALHSTAAAARLSAAAALADPPAAVAAAAPLARATRRVVAAAAACRAGDAAAWPPAFAAMQADLLSLAADALPRTTAAITCPTAAVTPNNDDTAPSSKSEQQTPTRFAPSVSSPASTYDNVPGAQATSARTPNPVTGHANVEQHDLLDNAGLSVHTVTRLQELAAAAAPSTPNAACAAASASSPISSPRLGSPSPFASLPLHQGPKGQQQHADRESLIARTHALRAALADRDRRLDELSVRAEAFQAAAADAVQLRAQLASLQARATPGNARSPDPNATATARAIVGPEHPHATTSGPTNDTGGEASLPEDPLSSPLLQQQNDQEEDEQERQLLLQKQEAAARIRANWPARPPVVHARAHADPGMGNENLGAHSQHSDPSSSLFHSVDSSATPDEAARHVQRRMRTHEASGWNARITHSMLADLRPTHAVTVEQAATATPLNSNKSRVSDSINAPDNELAGLTLTTTARTRDALRTAAMQARRAAANARVVRLDAESLCVTGGATMSRRGLCEAVAAGRRLRQARSAVASGSERVRVSEVTVGSGAGQEGFSAMLRAATAV